MSERKYLDENTKRMGFMKQGKACICTNGHRIGEQESRLYDNTHKKVLCYSCAVIATNTVDVGHALASLTAKIDRIEENAIHMREGRTKELEGLALIVKNQVFHTINESQRKTVEGIAWLSSRVEILEKELKTTSQFIQALHALASPNGVPDATLGQPLPFDFDPPKTAAPARRLTANEALGFTDSPAPLPYDTWDPYNGLPAPQEMP